MCDAALKQRLLSSTVHSQNQLTVPQGVYDVGIEERSNGIGSNDAVFLQHGGRLIVHSKLHLACGNLPPEGVREGSEGVLASQECLSEQADLSSEGVRGEGVEGRGVAAEEGVDALQDFIGGVFLALHNHLEGPHRQVEGREAERYIA